MSPRTPRVSRRQLLRTGGAAVGVGLAGCSAPGSGGDDEEELTDWPAFAHDQRNTGYLRDDTAPPDQLTRLWTYETAFRNAGPAAVSRDTVFHVVGQRLYAFDRLDKTVRWKTTVGTWGSEPPILVDGTVYLGYSGGVRAVDGTSGDVSWTLEVSGGSWGTPGYADGTVIASRNAGSGAGGLLGIRNGNEQWRFETDAGSSHGPTVADGVAYVGTVVSPAGSRATDDPASQQSVFAVSVDDGSEEWRFEGVSDDVSVPAVADGRVYVACADDHLYALDAESGEQTWASELSLSAVCPPTVVNGVVFVGSPDGHVYALDAETGDERYRVDVGAPVETGLAVVDEVNEDSQYEGWRQRLVYAGTTAGTVSAIKTETQSVLSSVDLGASVEGALSVRDRLVHVATADGNVHVLGE